MPQLLYLHWVGGTFYLGVMAFQCHSANNFIHVPVTTSAIWRTSTGEKLYWPLAALVITEIPFVLMMFDDDGNILTKLEFFAMNLSSSRPHGGG